MLTKERVFEIMGKYYGNAHYRSAIRLGISEHDLKLTTELLDRINALGYYFSNCHRLDEIEDRRFPPLVLDYYAKFESTIYQTGVLAAIRFKSYHEFVPQLLQIYESSTDLEIRYCVSDCIRQINSPKYVDECLRIVNQPTYGAVCDQLVTYLCKRRVHKVIPRLLELLEKYPKTWRWTFLRYVVFFKDPSLIPYVEPFLQADDSEIRSLARTAIKKLEAIQGTICVNPIKTLRH